MRFVAVGLFVATGLLGALPSASAVPIDGNLAWEGQAEVFGTFATNDVVSWVQRFEPGTHAGDYRWSLTASHLTIRQYYSEQSDLPQASVTMGGAGHSQWKTHEYSFDDASVEVELRPTRTYGASAVLYSTVAGETAWVMDTGATEPAKVRSVRPEGAFMEVPSSTEDPDAAPAYTVPAPEGRLLELEGPFGVELAGKLRGALFGWTVHVESDEGTTEFDAGVTVARDPSTGLRRGTRIEYVLLEADGLEASLPSAGRGLTLYTPLLQYFGLGEYPAGKYAGRSQDLAPGDLAKLPVSGNIWLGSLPRESAEDNRVHAWGDAAWTIPELTVAAPATTPPSMLAFVAAAGGLFLGTQLLPAIGRAARTGLFLLYARLREQGPLDNPTRQRIFELVRSEPGLNLSRIVEVLDIGWGTAAYHTQILKRQNRLKEVRFLNRVCFFPSTGAAPEDKQVQTLLLRQPNYHQVMSVLRENPGLSQREVADRTDHARQYISRLVAKMERAGLVRTESSPNGRRYFPLGPDAPPMAAGATGAAPIPASPAVLGHAPTPTGL